MALTYKKKHVRKFEILRPLFGHGIVFQCSMMCIQYFGACFTLRLIEAKMTLRTKNATENEQVTLLLAWHGYNCRFGVSTPIYRGIVVHFESQ